MLSSILNTHMKQLFLFDSHHLFANSYIGQAANNNP